MDAKQRLEAKNKARRSRKEKPQRHKSIVESVNPANGTYTVKEGQNIIPDCKPITNGAIAIGQAVARRGRLIDAMRVPKKKQQKVAQPKKTAPTIKYVLRQDSGNTSTYWVCGEGDDVEVFSVDTTVYEVVSVAIDNLGADGFYVHAHLRKISEQVDFIRLYGKDGLDSEVAIGDTIEELNEVITSFTYNSTPFEPLAFETNFISTSLLISVTTGYHDYSSFFSAILPVKTPGTWIDDGSDRPNFQAIGYGKWIGNYLGDKDSSQSLTDESNNPYGDFGGGTFTNTVGGFFAAKLDVLQVDELVKTAYPPLTCIFQFFFKGDNVTGEGDPNGQQNTKIYDYSNIPAWKTWDTSAFSRFKTDYSFDSNAGVAAIEQLSNYAIWYHVLRTSEDGSATLTKRLERDSTRNFLTATVTEPVNKDELLFIVGESESTIAYTNAVDNLGFAPELVDVFEGSFTIVDRSQLETVAFGENPNTVEVKTISTEFEVSDTQGVDVKQPSIEGDTELLCASYHPG